MADGTIVDQHKRRAWTIKSTHDETKDHTRDEKGFEKFEDYFRFVKNYNLLINRFWKFLCFFQRK